MCPCLTKQTTKFRTSIPAEECLGITLQYLATGEIYESILYQFRIHRTTISQIIQEVCNAIYKVFQPDYMNVPSSPQEWKLLMKDIAAGIFQTSFELLTENIKILKPKRSGSNFYNYKGFYSAVLLAFFDYDYRFLDS